jgi:predicted RNase H-like nuclease
MSVNVGAALSDERLLGVGVDGAPGGWLAACCFGGCDASPEGRRSEPRFFGSIAELADWRAGQPGGGWAPVAIDIPIGLPETVSFRACDQQARDRLGKRLNSVFHPPARYLLVAAEPVDGNPPTAKQVFARVQQLVAEQKQAAKRAAGNAATSSNPVAKVLGLSQQGAGLLLKVAEVDAFLLGSDSDSDAGQAERQAQRQEWLFEVHPELCFAALTGGTVLPPKPTAHGQLLRLDLVRHEFPDAEQRIRGWDDGARHSLLDICDAYAACWSALRWAQTDAGAVGKRAWVTPPLEVLGEEAPGRPSVERRTGLPMRMVV